MDQTRAMPRDSDKIIKISRLGRKGVRRSKPNPDEVNESTLSPVVQPRLEHKLQPGSGRRATNVAPDERDTSARRNSDPEPTQEPTEDPTEEPTEENTEDPIEDSTEE